MLLRSLAFFRVGRESARPGGRMARNHTVFLSARDRRESIKRDTEKQNAESARKIQEQRDRDKLVEKISNEYGVDPKKVRDVM